MLRPRSPKVSDTLWNQKGDPKGPAPMSVGQILEHIVISHDAYVSGLRTRLPKAPQGDGPVKFSRVGSFLIRVAGPDGDAPIPPPFKPSDSDVPRTATTAKFFEQQRQFLELIPAARGRNLSRARFPNPVVPILPMNLADVFELFAEHAERHVRQIQARVG